MKLVERDRKLIWHPLTQEKTADLPITITSGKGAYIYDENGKSYIDLISSWWVNLHGHAHPKIAESIYNQALKLEHVIFAGFTHEPAVKLCEGLKTLLPGSLARFFFSDNGSTSIEVALKMAYQFWWNKGERDRKIFLSFEGGYHGDTFGAMAVSKSTGFCNSFKDLLFKTEIMPYPYTWKGDSEIEEKEDKALQAIKTYLKNNENKIAGFIIEPLIQGASGMRVCRPSFLQKVIDCLREYKILVIFDEVMTGFYRTGTMFALNQVGREPDIICLSKGLTGGFLPLALTVATQEIYNAFLSDHFGKALAHSHSYTANPLGCAAGIASLEILQSDATLEQIKKISATHEQCLSGIIAELPQVKAIRSIGTIAAFNIGENATNYAHPINAILKKKFLEDGLLLRPLGNTIYLMPPYCIDIEELKAIYRQIADILNSGIWC